MSNVFTRLLQPRVEFAYALLRILAGAMFAFHGAQKLFGVLSTSHPVFPQQLWFGGVIELVAGSLIALGLFTRCAAFVASGTMAVAYVQFHWRLSFGANFFPAVNKGELAVMYSIVFFFFACRGGGPYSVDGKRAS